MNIRSCKAKGRRCAQEAKDAIIRAFAELQPDDILVTSSGVTGEDLVFSPKARRCLPVAIECKNTETINIWKAYQQATQHANEAKIPLLIFRRNRSKLMACLSLEDLLLFAWGAFQYGEKLSEPDRGLS